MQFRLSNIHFLKSALFALVLCGVAITGLFLSYSYAHAQGPIGGTDPGLGIEQKESTDKVNDLGKTPDCGISNFYKGKCIARGLAWVAQIFLNVVGYVLIFSAFIFDKVKDIALNPDTYKNIDVVKRGWTMVRDVTNIFFIFILLVIAIATILRRESYGAKQLLPRLILVALFINFSFTITLYAILPANSLANYFTTIIRTNNKGNSIDYYADSTEEVAQHFIDGLKPGELATRFANSDQKERYELLNSSQNQILENSEKDDQAELNTAIYLIITIVFGIALILMAAFVLLVAALLFLIRIAILWVLMIFAPLAFLFMILPRTQSIAREWWSRLIDQALFPAVFLFFFFIVVSLGASTYVKDSIFKISDGDQTNFVAFVAYYLIQVILLYISLIVARRMGGYAGSTAISWAGSVRKFATGAAGGIVGGAAGYAASRVAEREVARRGDEGMAELKTGGAFSRLQARTIEKLAAPRAKDTGEYAKSMMSLAPREFMSRFKGSSLAQQNEMLKNEEAIKRLAKARDADSTSAQDKAHIDSILKRQSYQTQTKFFKEAPKAFAEKLVNNEIRKDTREEVLKTADKETMQKIGKAMVGIDAEETSALFESMQKEGLKKQSKDMASVLPQFYQEAGMEIGQAIRNIDFEKVDKKVLESLHDTQTKNGPVLNNPLARYTTPAQRQKLLSEFTEAGEIYSKEMKSLGDTSKQVAAQIRSAGDAASANKFENDKVFAGAHGLHSEDKTPSYKSTDVSGEAK
ncbi:MAG: hypothetical protein COU47_02395 [Candidatus Niyogibacteria bacterium CG10_big_fil_rev_8_21_14_0_10_46_36]|uniref:Uncharacterized protein n=1 Tax=Candidatus Niyogibacteria bacterium CG10_big_fil_rev_8_21_14_0_10_46_36 TaxID=1974726 RepID=A0A2H0TDF9_9BACT|nr:MAG: hypothetical protein COU47_02395 [Candidatus Niyogibacteria bacterium CG10_big_fil_rev_8_21_14_0_10_46_36]